MCMYTSTERQQEHPEEKISFYLNALCLLASRLDSHTHAPRLQLTPATFVYITIHIYEHVTRCIVPYIHVCVLYIRYCVNRDSVTAVSVCEPELYIDRYEGS